MTEEHIIAANLPHSFVSGELSLILETHQPLKCEAEGPIHVVPVGFQAFPQCLKTCAHLSFYTTIFAKATRKKFTHLNCTAVSICSGRNEFTITE